MIKYMSETSIQSLPAVILKRLLCIVLSETNDNFLSSQFHMSGYEITRRD